MSPSTSPAPVVMITAGSAGLGAAAARTFAKAGYRVVINYYTNTDRANALLGELLELSPLDKQEKMFLALKADLAKRDDIKSLVSEAVQHMGRLDAVFSNGGWTRIRDLSSLDENCVEEDWDRAFTVNVKSHLWLLHAAREELERSDGAFITTASVAGVNFSGSSLAYSVTKAAQIHLIKGLAVMAAPRIRVNSVSPGLLMTEWGEKFSDEAKDKHRERTKLKRFATVEDVAEQVLLLAKSKSVTGTNGRSTEGHLSGGPMHAVKEKAWKLALGAADRQLV